MEATSLVSEIQKKASFLCVGLDTDIQKIPLGFRRFKRPIFEFNKAVIEATSDLCVSYKLNTAFYESQGVSGWQDLEKTLDVIPSNVFTIADAKRGDIGNTAAQYAKTFFETFPFDSVTLNPYMGLDTLEAYAAYSDKTLIVLGLTSNGGSADFENQILDSGERLYEKVISSVAKNFNVDRTMFVVGATKPAEMKKIRKLAPDHFFLVPGVGAQGGSLEQVYANGKNSSTGLLVNASRGIIYNGSTAKNPQDSIREAAVAYQKEMKALLQNA